MADFSIAVKQAQLTEGPIHERATFGLLNIEARGEMLARALRIESAVEHYQDGPIHLGIPSGRVAMLELVAVAMGTQTFGRYTPTPCHGTSHTVCLT